jgi:hypothetical protein
MRLVSPTRIRPERGVDLVSTARELSREFVRLSWIRARRTGGGFNRRASNVLARVLDLKFSAVEVVVPQGVEVRVLSWAYAPHPQRVAAFLVALVIAASPGRLVALAAPTRLAVFAFGVHVGDAIESTQVRRSS